MQLKHKILFLFFIVILLSFSLAGCASYTSYSLDFTKEHPYAQKFEDEKLKIQILPIITKEDAKKVFDRDNLCRDGLVPIYVSITNKSNEKLHINSFTLVTPNKNVAKRLTPVEAAESVKKSVVGRAAGWLILAGGVGAIASAVHTSSVNEKIVQDLVNKEFKTNSIEPFTTANGYLYFQIDKEAKELDNYKFVIEITSAIPLKVELPLKGQIEAK